MSLRGCSSEAHKERGRCSDRRAVPALPVACAGSGGRCVRCGWRCPRGHLEVRRFSPSPGVAGRSADHGGLSTLPVAARSVVSATLGAHTRAYRVVGPAGRARASNPAQRFSVTFSSSTSLVDAEGTEIGFRLRRMKADGSIQQFEVSRVRTEANRAVYDYGSLSEWYVNGPAGLEQGFTVYHQARAGSGWLTLVLGVSGNARPAVASNGQVLWFSSAGHRTVRYGDLVGVDRRGHVLPSSMQVHGNFVYFPMNTYAARYPVRIDPLIETKTLLTAQGSGDAERVAVATSADGKTALVGFSRVELGQPGKRRGILHSRG